VGNFMTFKILTDNTKKIFHCSDIHSACDPSSWNLWMDTIKPPPSPRSSSLSAALLPLHLMGRTLQIL
jgi:hypothetical protein